MVLLHMHQQMNHCYIIHPSLHLTIFVDLIVLMFELFVLQPKWRICLQDILWSFLNDSIVVEPFPNLHYHHCLRIFFFHLQWKQFLINEHDHHQIDVLLYIDRQVLCITSQQQMLMLHQIVPLVIYQLYLIYPLLNVHLPYHVLEVHTF
jgi:hypothetical protein